MSHHVGGAVDGVVQPALVDLQVDAGGADDPVAKVDQAHLGGGAGRAGLPRRGRLVAGAAGSAAGASWAASLAARAALAPFPPPPHPARHHRDQRYPNRRPAKLHAHPPVSVPAGWDAARGRTVPHLSGRAARQAPDRGLWTTACRVGAPSGSLLRVCIDRRGVLPVAVATSPARPADRAAPSLRGVRCSPCSSPRAPPGSSTRWCGRASWCWCSATPPRRWPRS